VPRICGPPLPPPRRARGTARRRSTAQTASSSASRCAPSRCRGLASKPRNLSGICADEVQRRRRSAAQKMLPQDAPCQEHDERTMMRAYHVSHSDDSVRVSSPQGDQRVAKEKARRRAAIMTRLEEENSVLQVLAGLNRLRLSSVPGARLRCRCHRHCSLDPALLARPASRHQRWLGDPAVQAARAGDARELAAAQRREQDLTHDSSALKARPFPQLRTATWQMLQLRVTCAVLDRTLSCHVADRTHGHRGHLCDMYASQHAHFLHCDFGWRCANVGSSATLALMTSCWSRPRRPTCANRWRSCGRSCSATRRWCAGSTTRCAASRLDDLAGALCRAQRSATMRRPTFRVRLLERPVKAGPSAIVGLCVGHDDLEMQPAHSPLQTCEQLPPWLWTTAYTGGRT